MSKHEVPKEAGMVLKKVGESDTFQFIGPIKPAGKYALMPKVEKESVGRIKVKLRASPEQVSTNSASYQQVDKWTVPTKEAILDAILLSSNTPATAQWELKINEDTIFTNKKQQNNLNLDIPGIDLRKGDTVTLNVKSNGAATILADGCIQGREIG